MCTKFIKKIPGHFVVAGSAWGSRFISIFVQFYSIKILLNYLGTNGYALFSLIASFSAWFLLVDIGMSTNLQNKISERKAYGKAYFDLVKRTGCFLIVAVTLFVIFLWIFGPYLSRILLVSFDFLSEQDKNNIFFISSLLFIGNGIGFFAYKIWYAEHKGWISNILPAISSICGLLFLILLRTEQFNIGHLIIVCLLSFYGPAAFLGVLSFLKTFASSLNYKEKPLSHSILQDIIRPSMGFFSFSVMAALVLQVDYIIMSYTLTGKDIVIYNVLSKIFGLINFLYAALLQSVWPLCAEAKYKDDKSIYNQIKVKYIGFGAILVFAISLFIYLARDLIILLLARDAGISFSFILIVLFAIYHMIRIWTDTYAMFLLSTGNMRFLYISVPCQALLSGVLQWYGSVLFGLPGIILGLIMSYILTVSWILPYSFSKNVQGRLCR